MIFHEKIIMSDTFSSLSLENLCYTDHENLVVRLHVERRNARACPMMYLQAARKFIRVCSSQFTFNIYMPGG